MRTIRLANIRLGLATNSSSTHSIVVLPKGQKAQDSTLGDGFNWEFFTAGSKAVKRSYIGALIRRMLREVVGDEMACVVAEGLTGVPPADYVDHQSAFALPISRGEGYGPLPTASIDPVFLGELLAFLDQPNVAILGGNDNSENDHPLAGHGTEFGLRLKQLYGEPLLARKDGAWWTVFCPEHGTRVTLSFDENPGPLVYEGPLLVDLKVTDACPFGCEYCYQSSTPLGKEADYPYLSSTIRELAQAGVFEVAIGGGEPTFLTQLPSILRNCRDAGIMPNLSTRSLHWLRDPALFEMVDEWAGGVALSVTDADAVALFGALLQANGGARRFRRRDHDANYGVQVAMGTVHERTFASILIAAQKAGLRVTCLDFKQAGKGQGFKFQPYDWFPKVVMERLGEETLPSLGIDTGLAAKFAKQMKVPGYLYQVKEGVASCYIDAVSQRIGPSSYCPESQMQPYDPHKENLRQVFQSFAHLPQAGDHLDSVKALLEA